MKRPTPYVYHATVVRVIDGDTIVADVDLGFGMTRRTTIRLVGINAPEKKGATLDAGISARDHLVSLLSDNGTFLSVTIQSQAVDAFGRALALIWVNDPNTDDAKTVNQEMVESGYAVAWGHGESAIA